MEESANNELVSADCMKRSRPRKTAFLKLRRIGVSQFSLSYGQAGLKRLIDWKTDGPFEGDIAYRSSVRF